MKYQIYGTNEVVREYRRIDPQTGRSEIHKVTLRAGRLIAEHNGLEITIKHMDKIKRCSPGTGVRLHVNHLYKRPLRLIQV